MGKVFVQSNVAKLQVSKIQRDERTDVIGGGKLLTRAVIDLAIGTRQLTKISHMIEQGLEVVCTFEALNAKQDVDINYIDLPHQMGFDEKPKVLDQTANAAFPPIGDKPEPGATAIRTGEPLVSEAEANAEFDAIPSGNDKGKPDLAGLKIKPPKEGQTGFTVSLNGTKEKGELVPTILKVFCAKDSKELTDTLLSYPQSKNRDMLLEILQINAMPESVR